MLDEFKGDCRVHSSQFTEPKENANGKRAVIVGCCNSDHHIAKGYMTMAIMSRCHEGAA